MTLFNPVRLRRQLRIVPLILVVTFSIASIAITLYVRGRMLMEEQIDLRLIGMASVAAQQFSAADLEKIRGTEFIDTDVLLSTTAKLERIRLALPSVVSVSILRMTGVPGVMEYVADARLLHSFAELDRNGNSMLDPGEEQIFPGEKVQVQGVEAYREDLFERPVISRPVSGGNFDVPVVAYAPIRTEHGGLAAVIAIGMDAVQYDLLTSTAVTPLILVLLVLFALLLGGYVGLFFYRRRAELITNLECDQLARQEIASHQLGLPYAVFSQLHRGGCIDAQKIGIAEGKIVESLERMETIIDELEGLHNFKSLKLLESQSKKAPLRDLVTMVVNQEQHRLERHRHPVNIEVEGELLLKFDQQLLAGVLRELIDNAIDYSPDDTPITVRAVRKGSYVQVDISDHGYGMDKEDQERVFEKFVRGKDAQKHNAHGLGLGLHISKKLIEFMGGTLRIKSSPGEGTTASFRLPVED